MDRHRFQSVKKWLTAVNHAKNQNDTSKHSKVRHFSRNFEILKNKQIILKIFSRANFDNIYGNLSNIKKPTNFFILKLNCREQNYIKADREKKVN